MYYLAIKQFAKTLQNLDVIIEKAQDHAIMKTFDVNNFFSSRLFPDMLPFAAQVRIACDNAKATAANLSGKDAPRHEDNETNIDELRGRIKKCLDYLATFTEADFAKTTPSALCRVGYPPGKGLPAEEYLFARQIPNFYFHVTTAYAILRAGGVDVGKGDFLGTLAHIDL